MNEIDLSLYTKYRTEVENYLGESYITALKADQELAWALTSYMVHSYLERRTNEACALKIKEKFPLKEQ